MTKSCIFDPENLLNLIHKKAYQTPFYLYDSYLLQATLKAAIKAKEAVFGSYGHIHYAMKANHNKAILQMIQSYDLGVDCVSGGEIKCAIDAGFAANQVVFAGVGKTDLEICDALKAGIFAFNCESLQEASVIDQFAREMNVTAQICFRVNPDINVNTHHYISTGSYDNKFGIAFEDVYQWLNTRYKHTSHIQFIGCHYHIGSQITDMMSFAKLTESILAHYKQLTGNGFEIKHINVGGGLGINYSDPFTQQIVDFKTYFNAFAPLSNLQGVNIHFELGRSLVGQIGVLISKVLFTKQTAGSHFAILDAGMTELMRPALYQAEHKIIALNPLAASKFEKYTLAGPICESSDIFAKNLLLPEIQRGNFIVIYSVGAYGKVLSSEYNLRSKVKEFLL